MLEIPTFEAVDARQDEMLIESIRGLRPFVDSDVEWIQDNITRYNSELSYIDTMLLLLANRRNVLAASLTLHSSALSPIRRLPSDVLISIFYYASFDLGDSLGYRTEAPWTLGKVCTWWRHIVLTSPVLWSTIVLEPPYDHTSPLIFAEYLRRSGNHPLYIGARFIDELHPSAHAGYGFTVPYELDVFELLLKQCARWRIIELHISDSYMYPLKSVSGHLSILEEMYLATADGFAGNGYFHSDVEPMTLLLNLPCIKRFFVKGFFLDEVVNDISEVAGPLLTHCCFDLADTSHLSFITHYPSLSELHLYLNPTHDSVADITVHPVQLRHEFLCYLSTDTTTILQDLVLPALTQISLQATSGTLDFICPRDLSGFVQNSKCQLTGLTMWMRYTDTSATMCANMVALPEVQTIEKVLFGFDGSYCERHLCTHLSKPGILPNLVQITVILMVHRLDKQWVDEFVAMVRLRWKGAPGPEATKTRRLEKVRLCVDPAESSERFLDAGLRELVAEGLCLDREPAVLKWKYWSGPYWFSV